MTTRCGGRYIGRVLLYALSTCLWCRRTRELLDGLRIPYECIYVDLLSGYERAELERELRQLSPRLTFPMVVIGDKVITGYDLSAIRDALGG